MPHLHLQSYSRESLEYILSMMRSYRNGLKQVGKRAMLVDKANPPPIATRIEYPSSLRDSLAKEYAQAVIRYAFPEYTPSSPPFLIKNDALVGGLRVFVGDDMVDISFQKIQSLLR